MKSMSGGRAPDMASARNLSTTVSRLVFGEMYPKLWVGRGRKIYRSTYCIVRATRRLGRFAMIFYFPKRLISGVTEMVARSLQKRAGLVVVWTLRNPKIVIYETEAAAKAEFICS